MKTFKFLTLALSICLLAACTSGNNSTSETQSMDQDSVEAPGIGAAPDNSDEVSDSTMHLVDTASVQRN